MRDLVQWYNELLLLLADKWDGETAKCITNKYDLINESFIALNDFTNMAMELSKNLVKADKRFYKYLENNSWRH